MGECRGLAPLQVFACHLCTSSICRYRVYALAGAHPFICFMLPLFPRASTSIYLGGFCVCRRPRRFSSSLISSHRPSSPLPSAAHLPAGLTLLFFVPPPIFFAAPTFLLPYVLGSPKLCPCLGCAPRAGWLKISFFDKIACC